MKRILLPAALLVAFAGSAAFAQMQSDGTAAPPQTTQAPAPVERPHHAHNPHKEAMKMSQKLGLTADQTAKIEPIIADREQKMEAMRADTSLTPEQQKKQAHVIEKQSNEQFATVLTPDQMAQMKAEHHNHEHHGPPPPADGAPPPPPTV